MQYTPYSVSLLIFFPITVPLSNILHVLLTFPFIISLLLLECPLQRVGIVCFDRCHIPTARNRAWGIYSAQDIFIDCIEFTEIFLDLLCEHGWLPSPLWASVYWTQWLSSLDSPRALSLQPGSWDFFPEYLLKEELAKAWLDIFLPDSTFLCTVCKPGSRHVPALSFLRGFEQMPSCEWASKCIWEPAWDRTFQKNVSTGPNPVFLLLFVSNGAKSRNFQGHGRPFLN